MKIPNLSDPQRMLSQKKEYQPHMQVTMGLNDRTHIKCLTSLKYLEEVWFFAIVYFHGLKLVCGLEHLPKFADCVVGDFLGFGSRTSDSSTASYNWVKWPPGLGPTTNIGHSIAYHISLDHCFAPRVCGLFPSLLTSLKGQIKFYFFSKNRHLYILPSRTHLCLR